MSENFTNNNNSSISTASWFRWLWDDANVIAPKISLQQVQRGGDNLQIEEDRGIFATDIILPNERIMFIPTDACLSTHMLQTRAEQILHQQTPNELFLRNPQQQLELDAICSIQEIKLTAKQMQSNWRDDDSMALYLIACWNILCNPAYADATNSTTRTVTTSKITASNSATEAFPSAAESIALAEAIIPPKQEAPTSAVEENQTIPIAASVLPDQEGYICGQTDRESAISTNALPLTTMSNTKFVSFLPHCQMLPKQFHNPLYFTDEELKLIEGTNCHCYTIQMKQQIYQDWKELLTIIEYWSSINTSKGYNRWFLSLQDISFQLYLWAYSNIYSRSTDLDASFTNLHIENEEDEDDRDAITTGNMRRVLVPLLDMMNHDFSSELVHSIDEHGNISVFNGPSIISAGEELCLNYGNFSNEKLLLVYGFTVHPNPCNHVNIYAPLPKEDPLYTLKASFLQKCFHGRNPDGPHAIQMQNITSTSDSILPSSLVSSLRLIGLQSYDVLLSIISQLQEVHDHDGDDNVYYQVPIINHDNEYAAFTALQEALHSMARQLALNLICDENLNAANSKEDEAIYSSNVSALHASNARTLCWGEYEILQMALAEVHHRLEVLEEEKE